MFKTLAFSTLLIISAAGCATGSHVVTGTSRPAVSPDAVKIYASVPEKAEILGTVSATNPNGFSHYLAHPELEILKQQAGDIGANGLCIEGSEIHAISGYQINGIAFFMP